MTEQALKSARKVVGVKQTMKALERQLLTSILLAHDADKALLLPLMEAADRHDIMVDNSRSMSELGVLAGIKVKAAAVGILKDS